MSAMTDMFTRICADYDRMNKVLSRGKDGAWRRKALVGLRVPARVLDLATGTGEFAFAAAERFRDAFVTGVDVTSAMVDAAKRKYGDQKAADNATPRFEFLEYSAEDLPFADGAFGLVTCAFGFRNFSFPQNALAEAFRVLSPGGELVVLDAFRSGMGWLSALWIKTVAALYAPETKDAYAYLAASIRRTVTAAQFIEMAKAAGFVFRKQEKMAIGVHALVFRKPSRVA